MTVGTELSGGGEQVHLTFLRDLHHGGRQNQPTQMAGRLARFVGRARRSVHIAIYDFRLDAPELAGPVVTALREAADRGVQVRIAYDRGKPVLHQSTEAFAAAGADPAPVGTDAWLRAHFAGSAVELRPIGAPSGKLMHDKYVVRDAHTPAAAVWTGSANFTDAAWSRQENNVLEIASPGLAAAYEIDFSELWQSGDIVSTGVDDQGTVRVGDARVRYAFGPGEGASIDGGLATLVHGARRDVAVASMVLTSHTILGALIDALDRGVRVWGIYDRGQMDPIVKQWEQSQHGAASAAAFRAVASHLVGKRSAPYTPDGPHDFMHDKLLVVDGRFVATGSHNLSRNATGNAENSLVLRSERVASAFRQHVREVVAAYARRLDEAALLSA